MEAQMRKSKRQSRTFRKELMRSSGALASANAYDVVPAAVADAGKKASYRFLEFFTANIRNANTRKAYYRNAIRFFEWVEHRDLVLDDIVSVHVAAYIEELGLELSKPTVKQNLAAIRMLFDWLVVGQIMASNPAAPVRGPKHVVKKGKPRLSPKTKPAACWNRSTHRTSWDSGTGLSSGSWSTPSHASKPPWG